MAQQFVFTAVKLKMFSGETCHTTQEPHATGEGILKILWGCLTSGWCSLCLPSLVPFPKYFLVWPFILWNRIEKTHQKMWLQPMQAIKWIFKIHTWLQGWRGRRVENKRNTIKLTFKDNLTFPSQPSVYCLTIYSLYLPFLHLFKHWFNKSNVTWFLRGQTSKKNCQ